MKIVLDKLAELGLLDEAARLRVRGLCDGGTPVEQALVDAGVDENAVLSTLGDAFSVRVIDLNEQTPERALVARYPAKILLEHRLLPIAEHNGSVVVASSRLTDTAGTDELRVASGKEVELVLARSEQIDQWLKQSLGVGADTLQSMDSEAGDIQVLDDGRGDDETDLSDDAEDASIIRFVNQVMAEGIEARATDVHIEPFEHEMRVRYRIDGVLVEANVPASVKRYQAAIVSRLKILSHLDIAEKRLPQDGRIKLRIASREVDVRVSVIPMLHGEAVVLRVLDRSATLMGLEHLGMGPRDNRNFERVLELPHGIVLVTGPTGSGKTTTLYAGLQQINKVDRKIITIEDPVEYHMGGINQIQVNERAGLTFGKGLRAILRHDPDVVLIGEIRDHETAQIAVQASLTGHLVFSTLHTNDAPGALTRLVDMGIEPYLVASSLELIMAQRLVRLICKSCREEISVDDSCRLRSEMGVDMPDALYHGVGCTKCQGTGYRGRQGVFEVMPVTDEIRSLILRQVSSGEIRKMAVAEGMQSLREDGWRLIRDGRTTLEEVLRVTKDEAGATYDRGEGGTSGGSADDASVSGD